MIFHEIYGCYYNAVAKILSEATAGTLTEKRMTEICDDMAFAESFMTIIPSLKEGKWQLLHKDLSTPLKHVPEMPLTTLQKRWMKALLSDPRIQLFELNTDFLADVEPLFTDEDIIIPDSYNDGDPYTDENYIRVFRTILKAVKNGKQAKIIYRTEKKLIEATLSPYLLEYSEREDKMRVWVNSTKIGSIINISRIESAELLDIAGIIPHQCPADLTEQLVLQVSPERMSVERCLMHFAHYEKETEQLPDGGCIVKLNYSKADRSEVAVQVLSFGPTVRVLAPDGLIGIIKERLAAQRKLSGGNYGKIS